MQPRIATLLTGLLLALGVSAQEAAVKSGPQKDQLLPGPFHPYNATGTHAGRPHCLVCRFGLDPVAAVFARELPEAGKPLAALLKGLDAAVEKHQAAELGAFVVFLSDDANDLERRQALVQKLQDLAKQLELKHVVLAIDAPDGPKGYDLSKEADVTVLLYVKHKILANHAYGKDGLTDKDVAAILAETEKLLPPARPARGRTPRPAPKPDTSK